ncbi:hypothetical protein PybrP1_009399 [[Pythium] brassicae (nom. inval.)]|nr:hypothetical protein PybrP1_009399 [[Pythium] brassicae (nom. inval.)]
MALLMPDINLRRKRKYLDRYWRKVLHENHERVSLKGLVPVSVISVPRSDSSAHSHIIARSRVSEPVDDIDAVNEPEFEPALAFIIRDIPDDADPRELTGARSKRRSSKTVSSSSKRSAAVADTPPTSSDRDLLTIANSGSTLVLSTGSAASAARSVTRSSGKPRSNSKFITRVKGQTLGTLIYRVHENEDNILELDFSYLAARNKRLEAHGADLVARALATNRTVLKLVMRDHNIGDAGAAALANMLRANSTLEYIDLYGNNISDAGAEAIAHALYGHESVTYLSMWSNQISNRGALALAEALKCNQTLKYLGLVHNRVSESGASALLEALDVNIHLETLNLAKNQLGDATTYKIRVALARNRLEAPKVISEMEKDEEEVSRRFAEMLLAGESDSDSSGFHSCSSGFLSQSGVDQLEVDSDASGYWV